MDKVAHFLIFCQLSLAICYTYPNTKKRISALFWAVLLGVLTEFIQQYVPGRNMEMYDGVADTFGVIVGYYCWLVYVSKQIERNE